MFNALESRKTASERVDFGGEIVFLRLLDPHKLDERMATSPSTDDFIGPVGRPVADDDPAAGQQGLAGYRAQGLADVTLFVIGRSDEHVSSAVEVSIAGFGLVMRTHRVILARIVANSTGFLKTS